MYAYEMERTADYYPSLGKAVRSSWADRKLLQRERVVREKTGIKECCTKASLGLTHSQVQGPGLYMSNKECV